MKRWCKEKVVRVSGGKKEHDAVTPPQFCRQLRSRGDGSEQGSTKSEGQVNTLRVAAWSVTSRKNVVPNAGRNMIVDIAEGPVGQGGKERCTVLLCVRDLHLDET